MTTIDPTPAAGTDAPRGSSVVPLVPLPHGPGGTPAPAAPATPAGPPGPMTLGKPAKDPRYLALRNFAASISVFNILGYTVLGFEQPWLWPILAVLAAYATDLVFELLRSWSVGRSPRFLDRGVRGVYEFLLPAHITALAVNMLIYANDQFLPVLFGVVVAVTAKHVLQAPIAGRMRHFMNPSNFGITVTLVAFSAWVSIAPPYQFTENVNSLFRVGVVLVLVIAGTVLNAGLTKRIPLIVGWMGGFVIQTLVRTFLFDIALMSALSVMTGVAFMLFTNYMITDPGTTPSKARAQFVFGASVAVVYGVLIAVNVVFTLFFAVTIVCAFRGAGWWVVHLFGQARARPANQRPEPAVGELAPAEQSQAA